MKGSLINSEIHKNHFIFDSFQKRIWSYIVLILYINFLNLLWIKKNSDFEEYGAFKGT